MKLMIEWFSIAAFFLLGIERCLYGWVYHFPDEFKVACKNGVFGSYLQNESLHWKAFMTLGIYVKIFQYSVALYDIFVRCYLKNPIWDAFAAGSIQLFFVEITSATSILFWIGLALVCFGQFLNYAVFKALSPIGVYYGWELGYQVERVTAFPYNIGIGDPQYWGVVICIWGIYIALGVSSWVFPILETFWYVMSMKIIEHSNGAKILQAIGVKVKKKF